MIGKNIESLKRLIQVLLYQEVQVDLIRHIESTIKVCQINAMPFQSEKQKKWMWANKPEMAREWTSKYGSKIEAKKGTMAKKDKNWIQKATKNMRKDKPCTGKKFGGPTCPPGTRRYNLAKTFRKNE